MRESAGAGAPRFLNSEFAFWFSDFLWADDEAYLLPPMRPALSLTPCTNADVASHDFSG